MVTNYRKGSKVWVKYGAKKIKGIVKKEFIGVEKIKNRSVKKNYFEVRAQGKDFVLTKSQLKKRVGLFK